MVSAESIRKALSLHIPDNRPFVADRDHAAVALVLAGGPTDLQLCFIRRVEKEKDPWSGHVAFPGGRASPGDASARAVAERETREEVALALTDAHWIGALSDLPVRLGGVQTSMVLSSCVYNVGHGVPALTPNEEVAEVYWVPLAHLWDPRNATHLTLARSGESQVFPAIHLGEHLIWGLTLRVLAQFFEVVRTAN